MLDPRLVEAIHAHRIKNHFKVQQSLTQKLAAELRQNPTALEFFAVSIAHQIFPLINNPFSTRRSMSEQELAFALMRTIVGMSK